MKRKTEKKPELPRKGQVWTNKMLSYKAVVTSVRKGRVYLSLGSGATAEFVMDAFLMFHKQEK